MIRQMQKGFSCWGASICVHLVLLALLGLRTLDGRATPKLVSVLSDLSNLERQEAFLDHADEIDLTAAVSLANVGLGPGSRIAPSDSIPTPMSMADQAAVTQSVSNRSLIRPLSQSIGKLALGATLPGLKGTSSIASGDEGMGAIDQITKEIIRQLDKNHVLIAWVLDCTRSLQSRREAIAGRIERIYREIDELGVQKDDAILTAVVSFGESTRFLLDRPTADIETIRKAIRSVKDDDTGTEHVFAAVRDTALRYRRYQLAGQRMLMMIVVTDETGDDAAMVDETTALLTRNRVPVYVLGPMATFGVNEVFVAAQDLTTKEWFNVPINRGPAARRDEVARVPFNSSPYASGFGPFALSQIALETGGIYFVFDDRSVPGPTYDREILMQYKPNYGPMQDYTSLVGQSPFRRTLMEVVEEGNALWRYWWPTNDFRPGNWREAVDMHQKSVAPFIAYADKAIARLKALEPEYEKEPLPRWRANFALTYARLLQARVRCEEYNWALADFKRDPLTLKDPKTKNGWSVAFEGSSIGAAAATPKKPQGGADNKSKVQSPRDAAAFARSNAWLTDAKAWFHRTAQEHAGTVWAEAARVEANGPVAARIVEVFFTPPGPPAKGKPPRI